ncbi:MAG: hypothetical protein KatS3mg015_2423 [Fimbriimonadales bacterium]|nr:MAG: hypothetical protein KatS3mg015_2423 [Fimbriimonadales bacterium]
MSLLTSAEVVPSRVLGIYRHLLAAKEPLSRDTLGARVWPRATRKTEGEQQPFTDINIREMLKLGLLAETEEGMLMPHPSLPEIARGDDIEGATEALPDIIADLVFKGNDSNHDLAYALAWYLTQDPLNAPGDRDSVPNAAREQNVDGLTGLTNDVRYGNFRDWACYLGFAWQVHDGRGDRLQVDPTRYLERQLPRLLPEAEKAVPIAAFVSILSGHCPAFEQGTFRREIEAHSGRETPAEQLSAATSMALFQLSAKGEVSFEARSDTESLLLTFGALQRRVTHLRRAS